MPSSVSAPSSSSSQAPARIQSTFHPLFWRVALALSALFLLLNLGYAPLFNPDEGRYGSASLEMVQGFDGRAPDWVVPHLNTVPRLNKPPLVYWTTGALMQLLGPGTYAARLAPALAALGIMALLWHLGRSMFDRRVATLGAIVWATATFPFGLARVLNTDMLLCLSITIAMVGIWHALEDGRWTQESGPDRAVAFRWQPPIIAGVGMGLALLAKGPVGMALPLLIGFLYLPARNWGNASGGKGLLGALLRRTGRDLGRDKILWLSLILACLLALALMMPWVLSISRRVPGFLHNFLVNENVGRFSGSQEYHDPTPKWFYVPVVLVGLLPWTMFLLWAGPQRIVSRVEDARAPLASRARWFLWLWALVPIVAFSFSHTKLVTYVLPAFPALCLLIGQGCGRLFANHEDEGAALSPRLWWSAVGFTALFNVLIAGGLTYYLTNGKTVPVREGWMWAAAFLGVLVGGSLALLLVARRRNGTVLLGVQWAIAMLLHALLLPGAGFVARYEESSPIVQAVAPLVQSDDRFVLFRTFQPASIFYLKRPVEIVDFNNSSGLSEDALRQSKYFHEYEPQWLETLLRSPQRVWILMKWQTMPEKLPANVHLIAANNDYRLLSNRPAPPDFQFRFIAPRKLERFHQHFPHAARS